MVTNISEQLGEFDNIKFASTGCGGGYYDILAALNHKK